MTRSAPTDSASRPEQIRAFVADFFREFGGEIKEDAAERLTVRLPPELRGRFGSDELRMVFRAQDADETTELVADGGYVLDKIHSVLQDYGWKTFVSLPPRRKMGRREARRAVRTLGCELGEFRRRRVRRCDVHFYIRISYQSDEKKEEIVVVRVDDEGRASWGAHPEEILSLRPEPTRRRFLPKSKLTERLRAAMEFAEREARRRAADVHERLLERLYRNVTRLKGFYERQMDEAGRRPAALEEIADLEAELQRKLEEQRANHQLRVVLKLINFAVVERPLTRWAAPVARGDARAEYVLWFDEIDGSLVRPACVACGESLEQVRLCDDGCLVCPDCARVCAVCGRAACAHCGAVQCRVCLEPLCARCASTCVSCGRPACPSHLRACSACGRPVCPECAAACAACGKTACVDHRAECSVCGRPVCRACQLSCAVCGEAFCASHAETCAVCGQVVCSKCVRTCPQCGRKTCANHAAECSVCGAAGCADHFHRCAASGLYACERHGAECAACGAWVLDEHLSRCSCCGEICCPSCASSPPYCDACLALILDWPDYVEDADPEDVARLIRQHPPARQWRYWRMAMGEKRRLFVAEHGGQRWLIVTDADLNIRRQRRIGLAPRVRGDPPF